MVFLGLSLSDFQVWVIIEVRYAIAQLLLGMLIRRLGCCKSPERQGNEGARMTYATRREGMVPVGRVGDYLAWNEKIIGILQSQPGLEGYFTLNSLGYPDKYTCLVLWESREAWRAAVRSPALGSFAKTNPTSDFIAESAPAMAYEVVLDIVGPGHAGVVNLNDFTVDVQGAIPAFVESRRVYWEGAKAGDPRFVRRLLLRQLGTDNRFVGFTLHTEFAPPDEPAGSWRPTSRSNFTTLPFTAERYDIVLQV